MHLSLCQRTETEAALSAHKYETTAALAHAGIEQTAPEYKFFMLSTRSAHFNCSGVHGPAKSLIEALQACLFYDWCGYAIFRPRRRRATLCSMPVHYLEGSIDGDAIVVARRAGCLASGDARPSAGHYALSKACRTADSNGLCECDEGMFRVTPWPRYNDSVPATSSATSSPSAPLLPSCRIHGCENVPCSPCVLGFCDVMPNISILPKINEQLQAFAIAEHNGSTRFRAINPGETHTQGRPCERWRPGNLSLIHLKLLCRTIFL
jgi:hypothetical protein